MRWFEDRADEIMSAQSNCLYVAVLTERQLVDAGTSAEIVRAVVTWRERIAEIIRDALATRPGVEVDAADLADHLFVTFEGSYLLCRSLGDPEPMRQQLRVFRQLLTSLIAPAGSTAPSR